MRDCRLGRQAALDQAGRRGRLHHYVLAGATSISWPPHDQHPERGRDDVKALGHILADPMERARAARANPALDIDYTIDPRQVSREGAAVRPAPAGLGLAVGRLCGLVIGLSGRPDLLDLF